MLQRLIFGFKRVVSACGGGHDMRFGMVYKVARLWTRFYLIFSGEPKKFTYISKRCGWEQLGMVLSLQRYPYAQLFFGKNLDLTALKLWLQFEPIIGILFRFKISFKFRNQFGLSSKRWIMPNLGGNPRQMKLISGRALCLAPRQQPSHSNSWLKL